jgi:hypothetical protein
MAVLHILGTRGPSATGQASLMFGIRAIALSYDSRAYQSRKVHLA